ncbi:MAG: type IV pilus biogenesis/stability protein PilW [Gammaproteobacteria bacterium]|nr:MAG: type IV pilus biogenesis/stability protein PilW [Gammaproteobacteria bacterium]RKZ70838.1 MAG: type IV pilus biogenesis/stability protein PilW [Gammaproteobacteria bacterium]
MRKIALINLLLCLGLIACNQTTDSSGSGAIRPTTGTNDVAAVNLNLGVEYLRLGQYEKALSKLEKAREADENYPPTYNTLAILYQRLGDKVKAEANYQHALRLNSSDASTLNNYGQFLCQEGRYDEAEASFLKAARNPLYSTPETALANAGTCAMAQGNLETAERYFRSALEQNPGVAVALIQMAQISYTNASYMSARAYLQRYLEISQHTAKSLWLGINIERELGDKNLLASYELLLKNKFPQSKEASLLEK